MGMNLSNDPLPSGSQVSHHLPYSTTRKMKIVDSDALLRAIHLSNLQRRVFSKPKNDGLTPISSTHL